MGQMPPDYRSDGPLSLSLKVSIAIMVAMWVGLVITVIAVMLRP